MKKVWVQFRDGIEIDERASVVRWVSTLVKMGSAGRTLARYANASDQEHFDRKLAGYLGKGRPILLLTEDAAKLSRVLEVEFPGKCTVVDAPV